MLKAVRQFLADVARTSEPDNETDIDHRVAAAALLVHTGSVDGEYSEEEREKLLKLVASRFSLDEAEADKIVADAETADVEAVDLYSFTSILKSRLDETERERIVEMMWEIVFADGEVHEFEDNLVWRVAELLGVSSRDRVRLKQEARRNSGQA